MLDLISRRQAIDVLHGYFDGMLETDTVCPADIYGLFECMPSAQPERKTGKWITKSTNGEMFDCCSACGYVEWDVPKNFCPNCGADMRGEHD